METTLINFNLPTDLKDSFDEVCRMSGRTRTSVLVELITTYIIDQSAILEDRRSRLYLAGRAIGTIRHFREQESSPAADTDETVIGVHSPSDFDFDAYDEDEGDVRLAVDAILHRDW